MNSFKIPTSVFSFVVRAAEYMFTRKLRQRRGAEAALRLVSILDRYVVDCAAVASDSGYSPFADPAGYDYRNRKAQFQDAILTLPDIPDHELLPIGFIDRARAIENRQNDTHQTLREAREYDDGSGDQYYAERQRIFSILGLYAAELSQELRTEYGLTPPSSEHRKREIILGDMVRYHDGYSIRLRVIERRLARQATMAASALTQEKHGGN